MRPATFTHSILPAISAAFLLMACSPADASPAQAEDGILLSRADDSAVLAAKAEAARTLPLFWKKLAAGAPGESDFVLKVGFQVKGGGVEQIWARPVRRNGDKLVVRLANEPIYLAKLKFGSEVTVRESQVSDWAYSHNGKLYGHFTTRVMLATATPADRAELEAELAPTPLEPEDR